MDIILLLREVFQIDENAKLAIIRFLIQLGIFILLVFFSWLAGQYTPQFVAWIIQRFSGRKVAKIYDQLINPLRKLFKITGTLILISLSLTVLENYGDLYGFLNFFIDLGVILSTAWLISRLFRQFVRMYGIEIIRKMGREVDELLLIAETFANIVIGFIAAVAFAQSQDINLVGLLASLGIGGLAIAFAAQKTLEQLLGTFVLYLDRPFIPGEYIRVSLNPHAPDVYGRVESIGLRSTKIRAAAKSTLLIVPNSILANLDIENVTRGKKVMVLLYLDFPYLLEEREQALVEQVIQGSTNSLFGIDPGSTKISLYSPHTQEGTRARVTFFILGSSENSLQLRKRLLELANEKISKQLLAHDIKFTMQEPTIYVDSPVTI